MPGVTISAGYGAGGSAVAPLLAERLGFQLLDRAISSQVADHLNISAEEAQAGVVKRSVAERFFGVLTPLAGGVVGYDEHGQATTPLAVQDSAEFRMRAEEIVRAALPAGVVVLGRAGAAALRQEPSVLRVRLFGPVEARVSRAVELEGVDADTARKRLREVDAARAHYVKRLYGVDINDSTLYHLSLDSTALSFEGCVDVIATAYAAFR